MPKKTTTVKTSPIPKSTFNIAPYLDFANHHQDSTHKDIEELCQKVIKYGFNSAFVNPYYIKFAKEKLGGKAKVGTVVSFPLGQELQTIKVACAQEAVMAGADEIDVCLNVALIKEANWDESFAEMEAIVDGVKNMKKEVIVKFIPEVGLLTADEIKKVATLIADSGADFFKTSTGGADAARAPEVNDVKLVREAVGDRLRIKVVGGIATFEQAKSFIDAGADRIGTSHAVEIVTGAGNRLSSSETKGE
jgi:deoxyribose-phosphate aldolase